LSPSGGPWDRGEVDGAFSDVGWHTSLTAVGGSVRITYYDRGNGDLKIHDADTTR
jgi:hypothetical protein